MEQSIEQAQLYKRLHAITLDDLCHFCPPEERMTKAILKLNTAAKTRFVLRYIQFEDIWQCPNEQSGDFELFLEFKLSPESLVSSYSIQANMNELMWRFVFPRPRKIAAPADIQSFSDYLDLLIRVEILDIENYEIEAACAVLDLAYDFSDVN